MSVIDVPQLKSLEERSRTVKEGRTLKRKEEWGQDSKGIELQKKYHGKLDGPNILARTRESLKQGGEE